MTPTPSKPHRYRCETCAHHIFHKGMKHPHFCDHPVAQNDGYLSLKFITLEEYERIQFMGCCSHSQHESAEQWIADLLEFIKKTPDDECGKYGLWKINSVECDSFEGNCTLCKVTKALALLRGKEG